MRRGDSCPYCLEKPTKFCECNSLKSQFPSLLKRDILWDEKQNTINPLTSAPSSNKTGFFICLKKNCKKKIVDNFSAKIGDIIRGSGCPFCSGRKV